jgi:hypothetical protein
MTKLKQPLEINVTDVCSDGDGYELKITGPIVGMTGKKSAHWFNQVLTQLSCLSDRLNVLMILRLEP